MMLKLPPNNISFPGIFSKKIFGELLGGAYGGKPAVGFRASAGYYNITLDNNWETLPLSSVDEEEPSGYYDNVLYRWTPPAGYVMLFGVVKFTGGGNSSYEEISIMKNGAHSIATSVFNSSFTTVTDSSVPTFVSAYANGTDYFNMKVRSFRVATNSQDASQSYWCGICFPDTQTHTVDVVRVRNTATRTPTGAAYTKLVLDSENNDTGGYWDAANSKLEPPDDCWVWISIQNEWTPANKPLGTSTAIWKDGSAEVTNTVGSKYLIRVNSETHMGEARAVLVRGVSGEYYEPYFMSNETTKPYLLNSRSRLYALIIHDT